MFSILSDIFWISNYRKRFKNMFGTGKNGEEAGRPGFAP